jgi:hypothetical protein
VLLTVYLAVEATALFGLIALSTVVGVKYEPMRVRSVSAADSAVLVSLVDRTTNYVSYSPTLGWTIKPNGISDLYRANSAGIRATREYEETDPGGRLRVLTFGDSFTHGDQVANEDTWQARLEALGHQLDVLNFGVPGYGVDQAYLRFLEEGQAYSADIVFIGFMPYNVTRHVNVFRPFHSPSSGLPLAKPRYVLGGDSLMLLENPMQPLERYRELLREPSRVLTDLGSHDYFYLSRYRAGPVDFLPSVRLAKMLVFRLRQMWAGEIFRGGRYVESSEAFQVTTAILDRFVSAVSRSGARPVIVILPTDLDVEAYRTDGSRVYEPLVKYLDRRGYQYVDLVSSFTPPNLGRRLDDLFFGHYTPLGNQIVADGLADYLRALGLLESTSEIQGSNAECRPAEDVQ